MQAETKQCVKCKEEFTLDQDDFSFYKKMDVPPPQICPDCRFKIRAQWRNETSLYSGRKCDLCGKGILSMYHLRSDYLTYCYKCYMSDSWDPKNFGKDYDFTKPFFEQLEDLFHKVPKNTTFISTGDGPNINSEYSNMAGGLKNCYLVFNGGIGEEMMYSRGVRHAKEVSDCYFGEYLERCYENVNTVKSNGIVFAKNTFDSMDSIFTLNCRNINNCFGCVNLYNKSHCWFNEQLSTEEYQNKIKEIRGSYKKMEEMKKRFEEFSKSLPRKENNNLKTANSVGDYLFECKNVSNSFEVLGAENSKNLFSTRSAHNSNGAIGYGYKSELLLECVAVGYSSRVVGSCIVNNSQDISYSLSLNNCHDCIGCDGLKNASHFIFNKPYEKEEYEKIKGHIIQELKGKGLYGLMMPAQMAPFAYNETIAQDNFPLAKEEALKQGFRWEEDIQKTEGKETMKPEDIPDHIKDVPDSITSEILCCSECNRNYKIIEQELSFYRKMVLPIPRKCFYCRHRDRVKRRGPYKFWDRKCDKCGKEIRTNYAPNQPEIVYCEACFQKEVY